MSIHGSRKRCPSLTEFAAIGLAACQSPRLPSHGRARKAWEKVSRSSEPFFVRMHELVAKHSAGKVTLFGYKPAQPGEGKYFLLERQGAETTESFVGIFNPTESIAIRLIGDRQTIPGTKFDIVTPKKAEGKSKSAEKPAKTEPEAKVEPASKPAAEPAPVAAETTPAATDEAQAPAVKPKRTRKKAETPADETATADAQATTEKAPAKRTRKPSAPKPSVKDVASAKKPGLAARVKSIARAVVPGRSGKRQSSGS